MRQLQAIPIFLAGLGILCLGGTRTQAAPEQPVLFDMETSPFTIGTFGQDAKPAGTVESVEGRFGRACKLTFVPDAPGGFFRLGIKPGPEWDRAAGISFWVKGDGSASWGGLEVIDTSDFRQRCGFCFSIDSTEWRKVVVRWSDLIPEIPGAKPIDPKGGYPPLRLGHLWFGKWWYWRDYPAHSFIVDHIALESSLPPVAKAALPARGGSPRTLALLKARKPVTIVTMGDSLSDKRHWTNRESTWSELLAARLKQTYGSEVRLVNPALGGTSLTANVVLMPRWLVPLALGNEAEPFPVRNGPARRERAGAPSLRTANGMKDAPQPDLVTIWFGFNDWNSGMRGPEFRQALSDAVDRIRRATNGHAEVLLMTTCPAVAHWQTMAELAEAARAVAREKRTGLADIAAAFHDAGKDEAARPALFASDKVHLGDPGRSLTAETVLRAIGSK